MVLDEPLLPGPEAIEIVTGHSPHYSQFFRWTQAGLKTADGRRIRLEFAKTGQKRRTSVAAVKRFFQAQTEAAMQCRPIEPPSNQDAERQERLVEEQLDEEGLKVSAKQKTNLRIDDVVPVDHEQGFEVSFGGGEAK